MIKKQYFIFLTALVTGTVLGLVDIFHFGKDAEASAGVGEIPFFSQSAPRFEATPVKKRDVTQISPSCVNLGVLIPIYANMSAEELRTEINRLIILSKNARGNEDISFLIRYLVMKVGRDFPGEAHSFLDKALINSNSDYAQALLEVWAGKDFDGAMECLLENANTWYFSSYVFPKMVRVLAEEHPDKAMQWMLSQTGEVRQNALSEMVYVLAEKHPEKIGEFVGKLLPEDLKKDNLFGHIAKKWGSCDWENALLWADTLSDKQKNNAIAGILGGLGTSNLEKATEEYKKQPQAIQGNIAEAIVSSISDEDDFDQYSDHSGNKKALEWLMANRSNADNSGKLARNIVGSSDLLTDEFTGYVQKMPEGTIKDNALRGMSNMASLMAEYGNNTYEAAFALTDQIKDPAIKMESKLNNVGNWIRDDPEAARDWIQEKSGFSDEEKHKQLKACEESIKRLKENPKEKINNSGQMSISTYES